MKHFIISGVAAVSVAATAAADTVVLTPKAPYSAEQAAAHTSELDAAVGRECTRAASPLVGSNFYLYEACLKATRAEVEKRDPTGLYAPRGSKSSTVLAER